MSFTLTCGECGSTECGINATYKGDDHPIEIVAICNDCGHRD